MGTPVPRRDIEAEGTSRPGEAKSYTLSPEELAKLAPAKPIPKSHHKPIEFRTPNKKTEEKKQAAVTTATAPDPAPEKSSNKGRPKGSTNKQSKPDRNPSPGTDALKQAVKAETKAHTETKKSYPAVELATLNRQESEALEKAIGLLERDGVLMRSISRGNWVQEFETLANIPITTMARALYAGYTIQETPEERIMSELGSLDKKFNGSEQRITDYSEGMLFVIHALNIKVPGLVSEVV